MIIKIIPNDTLFFRSGRPFSMGDETWADSIFPPYPSTVYGALRTFLLLNRGSLEKFLKEGYRDIGNGHRKGMMKIIGPVLWSNKENTLYFILPLNFFKVNNKNHLESYSLLPKPPIFYSNYPFENVFIYNGAEKVEEPKGWIEALDFYDYLRGEKREYTYIERDKLFEDELKIGISRDKKTFTSREGHIYRLGMTRLNQEQGLGFIVEVDDIQDFPEKGIFQLGAESKTVCFEKLNDDVFKTLKNLEFSFSQNIFMLYLATPAIFNKGWLPKWIDEDTFEGLYNGIKIKLLMAVLGRAIKIGGWDMNKKEPKVMYKAVPAGSVYYFKILEGNINKIKESFHFKTISDEKPEEGFGLTLLGEVAI